MDAIVPSYSPLNALITSTRDARAAGISDARIAAATRIAAAPTIGTRPGISDVGDVAADDPRERARRRSRPATMPLTRDHGAFASTRVSRAAGAEPIARRTPNSRVRALTENASTPATPTTAIVERDAGEPAEHQRVQPIRRQHLGADVLERRRALHRLIRRELANDARDRRHQRVRIVCAWTNSRPPPISCSNG